MNFLVDTFHYKDYVISTNLSVLKSIKMDIYISGFG